MKFSKGASAKPTQETDRPAEKGSERFRAFALALPGAVEGSHMGAVDFRVEGRIFATLAYETKGQGTLKLTAEQQAGFVAELPDLFEPAPGGWGRMGMTLLRLDTVEDGTMEGALRTAHRNVVEKKAASSAGRRRRPDSTR